MSGGEKMLTDEDLDRIEAACEPATPGPWMWRYYGRREGPDLVTTHSGMLYVMGFVRKGMQGAEPMFGDRQAMPGGRWTGGIMRTFSEWWSKGQSTLAPDALFMSTADPTTVKALVAELRRWRRFGHEETGADR